jgi:ribosomal protein L31E
MNDLEFTAVLNKEFKNTPGWRKNVVSVKLLKFVISHYYKTSPSLVKLDDRINRYLTKRGKNNPVKKIDVLLTSDSIPNIALKSIKVKLNESKLSWSTKRCLR